MRHFLVCGLLLLSQTVLFAQTSLRAELDRLLATDVLKTSEVGVTVYDLTANSQLYAYQDKKLYHPASVQKLITAITALSRMDVAHRLETSVYHSGRMVDGELYGDIYVVGGFDSEFDESTMNELLKTVEGLSLTKIHGRIYGDVSMMDSVYWGAGWLWDDNPYYFQPYLSPLMFNKGYVEVTALPAQKDSVALLSVFPHSSYYAVNNQTTSRKVEAGKFRVTRDWLTNGNTILVDGNVSAKQSDRVNIYASQDFFMHTFVDRLMEKGVQMDGKYAYAECSKDSSMTFVGATSHMLAEVLKRALKKSDNLSAEAVFYQLAAQASGKKRVGAEEGVKAVQLLIDQLGYRAKEYRVVDGSGISLYNFVSPELILAFLKYAYRDAIMYRCLNQSLPIAGIDGTLIGRMKSGRAYRNVRAKTGSMTGVSSLAGYATAANEHQLAFVIINQNHLNQAECRALQDKIAEIICSYK